MKMLQFRGAHGGLEDICQPHKSPALLSCPVSGGDEDANPGVLAPKSLCKAAVEHRSLEPLPVLGSGKCPAAASGWECCTSDANHARQAGLLYI